MLRVLLLCFAVLPACTCFSWTSSLDDSTIYACVNDTLKLPWRFTLEGNEKEVAIKWFFNKTTQDGRLLGVKTENEFMEAKEMLQQIAFLSNAEIHISNLKQSQFGVYSIRAVIRRNGVATPHMQTARVALPEQAVVRDSSLTVAQLPVAVFQNSTGQFHFQLAFGNFSDIGRPPVSAELMGPSRLTLTSTQIVNGAFVFSLPNPVEGGEYKVKLRIPAVSERCAGTDSRLTKEYETSVNGLKAALVVVQTAQTVQETKLQQQQYTLNKQQSNLQNVQIGQEQLREFHQDEAQQPANCQDVKRYDTMNGVHKLFLPGNAPFRAYCDQTTDTGGWTVISRRMDGSVNFNKPWSQYEIGFGDLHGEFWLGLKNIYELTKNKNYMLRVDIMNFNHYMGYALYNIFYISNSSDSYRLTVGGYSGNAGDSLSYSSNNIFSTYDKYINSFSGSCSSNTEAGWWYSSYSYCHFAQPIGRYRPSGESNQYNLVWNNWNNWSSNKRMEMKIKPRA